MSTITIASNTAQFSKYKNTDFDFDLPLIVKNCISISLNSIIIPFTYYVIHDFNNKFYVDTTEGSGYTLVCTLKPGTYTDENTFCQALQDAVNAALLAQIPSSTDTFAVTYVPNNLLGGDDVNRVKFTNTGSSQFRVLWSKNYRIAQMAGFDNVDEAYSNSTQAFHAPNLTGCDSIRVEMLPLSLNTQSNTGNTNYFQLPVNTNPNGQIIWISQYDSSVAFNALQNIQHLRVRLLEADTLLPLGGSYGLNNPIFLVLKLRAKTS